MAAGLKRARKARRAWEADDCATGILRNRGRGEILIKHENPCAIGTDRFDFENRRSLQRLNRLVEIRGHLEVIGIAGARLSVVTEFDRFGSRRSSGQQPELQQAYDATRRSARP